MQVPRKEIADSHRDGAILVLVAVFLVGLMSLLALVVDGGAVTHQRRLAQPAADAGAIAAAIEIYRQRPESVDVTALGEAQRNGFTHGAAAREGTRFAAVRGKDSGQIATVDAVRAYVRSKSALSPITVNTTWEKVDKSTNSNVTVTVSYDYKRVGLIIPNKTLTSSSTMRIVF